MSTASGRTRWSARCLLAVTLAFGFVMAGAAGWFWWHRPEPRPPTEIFQGVVYSCEHVPAGPESRGLMHLVRVDLTTPGLELYVTPLDPEAVAAGWQYRLKWTPSVADTENLSVVDTGALFHAETPSLPMPGDYARSLETLVADHAVNHVHEHTYLLWFEDDLTPHLEKEKPPSPDVLRRARWGVGGQGVHLSDGVVSRFTSHEPDRQILVGIDPRKKLLFLAAFEHASVRVAARMLAGRGVKDAISMDSGGSASLVIGDGAQAFPARTLLYPERGVPTHFGLRAPQLAD